MKAGEREGEGRYKIKWSKVTKKFTAQPVLEKKNYDYLNNIMANALANMKSTKKTPTVVKARSCMAPLERENRNVIIERTMKYCRLSKN